MMKKTTVLLALISMCLITTAGIGAVSASDEAADDFEITTFKINPDGTTTPIKTLEGSGPMMVTATLNEDGSMNITENGIRVPEDELCGSQGIFYPRPGPVIANDDDEPAGSAKVGTINPDGTVTPIKTFRGSGPMSVIVTRNEDGSMNITKNGLYYKPRATNHTWYTHVTTPITESNNNR